MSKKELFQGIFWSGLLTLCVFLFHYIFPSMINNFHAPKNLLNYSERIAHSYLENIYEYHTNFVAFAVRPLTSFLIESTHVFFHLSYGNSFIFVNFLLLFFAGVALYKLSREWKYTHSEAILSLFLFFLSFSVLFSFFSSIYSYDEPLQYLCIFLSFIFWYRKQFILFFLFFTIAIICRETTLFLIPALFFIPLTSDLSRKNFFIWEWKRFFLFIAASCVYLFFKINFLSRHFFLENLSDYTSKRLEHLFFNFQNIQYTIESIFFCVLILLPSLFFLITNKKEIFKNKFERNLLRAFFVSACINTLLVFFTARAREARLFALPLVFLWPLLGKYGIFSFEKCKISYRNQKFIFKILLFLTCCIFSFFIGFAYRLSAAGNFDIGYHVYSTIILFFLFFASSLIAFQRKK